MCGANQRTEKHWKDNGKPEHCRYCGTMTRVRWRFQTNGVKYIRNQCPGCGWGHTASGFSYKKLKKQFGSVVQFDDSAEDHNRAIVDRMYRNRGEAKGVLHKFLSDLRKKNYTEYINSPMWEARRQRILKRDKNTCQMCGRPAIQVHHKSYDGTDFCEVVFNENDDDLISLCIGCHRGLHGLDE